LEKNGYKNHPKKRHEHCLLRWLADAKKKKAGVEQEKVAQVILDSS
jgi:hypothetical protein